MQPKLLSFLLLFSSLLAVSFSQAQNVKPPSKFYIKVYGGYGLLTPGSYKTTSLKQNLGNTTDNNFSVSEKGLGNGLHFGGGVGYTVNDFLNLGVDAEYLKGKSLRANINFLYLGNTYIYNTTIPYSVLSLIPNITFKALSTPAYFIYTRLGIIATLKTKISQLEYDTVITSIPSANTANYDNTIYSNKLSIGVQTCLGIQFKITDKIRGFSEVAGNFLPISPTSSVETKGYTSPRSAEADPPIKITYTKSGTRLNNVQPRTTYNANYIALNAGFIYKF